MAIQWRNKGAHTDAAARPTPEAAGLRLGLTAVLGQCEGLTMRLPVWVEEAGLSGGRGRPRQLNLSYLAAVGTARLGRRSAEVDATCVINSRELYYWSRPEADPPLLTPFFQWDEQASELFLLNSIEQNVPTFTASGKSRPFPNPATELRQAASFLFARSPGVDAAATALASADRIRDQFQELALDAGEDGSYSPEDLSLLEKKRLRLGLSEQDAREIMAEALLPAPSAVPPLASLTVAPATPADRGGFNLATRSAPSPGAPPVLPGAKGEPSSADPEARPTSAVAAVKVGTAWGKLVCVVGRTPDQEGHSVLLHGDDFLLMQGPDGHVGVFAGKDDFRQVVGRLCRIGGKTLIRDHVATKSCPGLNGEPVVLALMDSEDVLALQETAYQLQVAPGQTQATPPIAPDLVMNLLAGLDDYSLWVRPNIPASRLAGALSTFAKSAAVGEVLVLYDNTIWESGKAGLLLTATHIWGDDSVPWPMNSRCCLEILKIDVLRLAADRCLHLGADSFVSGAKLGFAVAAVLHLLGGPRPIVEPLAKKPAE